MDVQLVMFKTNGKRHDFPLNQEITVLGRGHGCDLRIPLTSVSREHCQIELRDDGAYLSDLGSSNGTYHNSDRITEVLLEAGDTVMVGPVHFTVVVDGEPEDIEPVKTILEEEESTDQPAAKGKKKKKSVNILADSDVADALDESDDDLKSIGAFEADENEAAEPKKTTPISKTEDSDDIASFLEEEEELKPKKAKKEAKSEPKPTPKKAEDSEDDMASFFDDDGDEDGMEVEAIGEDDQDKPDPLSSMPDESDEDIASFFDDEEEDEKPAKKKKKVAEKAAAKPKASKPKVDDQEDDDGDDPFAALESLAAETNEDDSGGIQFDDEEDEEDLPVLEFFDEEEDK